MDTSETETVYRGDLARLMHKVLADRGLDLHQYRRAYVERRIVARMRLLNMHSYRQYGRCLDERPDEYGKLVDTLTINVTDFFRDPTVFQVVRRDIIPALIAHKRKARQHAIRVWSAGCATGEEAYSVAMAVLDALGEDAGGFLFTVFATDLDPGVLATARKATYDASRLANISRVDQLRFVHKHGDTFTIRPEVTRHVKFRRLNLFKDDPMKLMDIVFCRNVFIYFTREQQALVLERFLDALVPGGYLVLGRSEKMAPRLTKRFELVNGRERVYRKPYNGGTPRG